METSEQINKFRLDKSKRIRTQHYWLPLPLRGKFPLASMSPPHTPSVDLYWLLVPCEVESHLLLCPPPHTPSVDLYWLLVPCEVDSHLLLCPPPHTPSVDLYWLLVPLRGRSQLASSPQSSGDDINLRSVASNIDTIVITVSLTTDQYFPYTLRISLVFTSQ